MTETLGDEPVPLDGRKGAADHDAPARHRLPLEVCNVAAIEAPV